jgi:hypothetical protein
MNGQALDQMSGVQGLLTRGQDNYREVAPTGDVPTGTDLLARTPSALSGSNVVGGPEDVGFGIDAEWLDDVHSPTLVITRAYIGPDRWPSDRWVPGSSGPPARPATTFRINWVRRIAQIVCITMAVALPPTLIAARSLPPAPSPPPKVPGSLARSGVRPFAASARQVARADAAHQRFLARQEAASEAAFRRPDAVASAATGARATRVRAVGDRRRPAGRKVRGPGGGTAACGTGPGPDSSGAASTVPVAGGPCGQGLRRRKWPPSPQWLTRHPACTLRVRIGSDIHPGAPSCPSGCGRWIFSWEPFVPIFRYGLRRATSRDDWQRAKGARRPR